jgi:hypothetical protein
MSPVKTPELDAVQQWFQAVVSHPGGLAEGVASEEAQRLMPLAPNGLETVIRRSQRLTAEERLAIYAHSYWARLLECLGDVFPVLRRALGDEVFEGFAFEYLQRYPSRSYTLDRLGDRFPQFLEETRPPEGDWPDFLVDLARLELTLAKVFDGPGVEGRKLLSHDDLQALPPERFAGARLVPVVCLHLLTFRFPVNAYFTAVRHAEAGDEVPVPEPAEEWTAVLRRDFVVRRYALSRPQHALLEAVLAGATVGQAVAAAAAASELDDEELAAALQSWFRFWTAEGFFHTVTE